MVTGSNLQLVKDIFRLESFKIAFFIATNTKRVCFDKKMILNFWFMKYILVFAVSLHRIVNLVWFHSTAFSFQFYLTGKL